jgi:hypothetical protein
LDMKGSTSEDSDDEMLKTFCISGHQ